MSETDESDLSEITILPDGRVYAFGITRQVTELLHSLESRPTEPGRPPAADELGVRTTANPSRRPKESD
jgi:hypothetical protein